MTILIFVTIAIATIAIALLVLRQQRRVKAKAKKCANEALWFHQKLKLLSDPSHFFSDEELHSLKIEFAPLLNEVNKLYDNILVSNEFLDNLGLKDFMDERKILNHIQIQNNKQYNQQKTTNN